MSQREIHYCILAHNANTLNVEDNWYQEDKKINPWRNKKQLIESIVINDFVETDKLNNKAEEVQRLEEAAEVTQQYEEIIQTKRKGIISIEYHEGKVFKGQGEVYQSNQSI